MKIGIDLDGVCYGFTEAFCDIVGAPRDYVATKWQFFEDLGFDVAGFLDVCKNSVKQGKLFRTGYLLPGTKEAFEALRAMGHTIHIVTDRCSIDPDDGGLIIPATKQWLADNGLVYDSIHFTGEKAQVAKALELDFFLDDKIENYEALMPLCDVKLLDQPWNQEATHAARVYSWQEFVQCVARESLLTPTADYDDFPIGQPLVGHTAEIRVTSKTGGEKGQKMARIGSLDPQSIMKVAEVAGFGEQKYARLNYLRGYDWSLSYDACQRHLHAFWSGQDLDPESGLPHLAHAAWHCLAMLAFMQHGLGTDDRYIKEENAA